MILGGRQLITCKKVHYITPKFSIIYSDHTIAKNACAPNSHFHSSILLLLLIIIIIIVILNIFIIMKLPWHMVLESPLWLNVSLSILLKKWRFESKSSSLQSVTPISVLGKARYIIRHIKFT